jgi:hypothetical protein
MTRNLSTRKMSGKMISLDWNEDTDEVTVSVKSATEDFTIREIPHPLALDVFHHPYSYATRLLTRGTFAQQVAA